MRIFKRLWKILFFIALFAVFNGLFSFFVEPFCSSSSEMWDKYRAKADTDIDMIYIGTSACYEDIDPSVVDEYTGLTSYNMGTNSQTFYLSREALLTAIEDHNISQAVFVFDDYYLLNDQNHNARAEASFIHAQNKGTAIPGRLYRSLKYMFDPEYMDTTFSVNYLFPWLVNRMRVKDKIFQEEMRVKLGLDEAVISDTNNIREEDGFKPFHYTLDFSRLSVYTKAWSAGNINEDALDTVKDIINICDENNVKLTFVVPPYPAAKVLARGNNYFEKLTYIKRLLSNYDVNYYDFNVAHSDLFEYSSEYFKDENHCNVTGATAFSKALGTLLTKTSDGSNLNSKFYWDWDSYAASVDWIDNVELVATAKNGSGIKLQAYARAGSMVYVKYLFQYYDEEAEEFVTFRTYDWSSEAWFVPENSGKYTFRVIVKKVNGDDGERRRKSVHVSYYAN